MSNLFQVQFYEFNYFRLKVKTIPEDGTTVTDISAPVQIDASTSGSLSGYTDVAGPVSLGDHMALVIEEDSSAVSSPGDILDNYS